MRIVPAIQLDQQLAALETAPTASLERPGVYAFDGCQDGRPFGGVLYVGTAGGKGNGRKLRKRVRESSRKFIWGAPGERGFYSDVWNLTLRWAPVDPSLVLLVEALLIRAHAPSFNAQQVRSKAPDDALDLVIMNGGEKGPLLPTVCGHYYDPEVWK